MANNKGRGGRTASTGVAGGHEPLSRLALDIPKALHTRIKVACAAQQRSMRDVLLEVLERHFPPDGANEESGHRSRS